MMPIKVWEFNIIGSALLILLGMFWTIMFFINSETALFGLGVVLSGTALLIVSFWGYVTVMMDMATEELENLLRDC